MRCAGVVDTYVKFIDTSHGNEYQVCRNHEIRADVIQKLEQVNVNK